MYIFVGQRRFFLIFKYNLGCATPLSDVRVTNFVMISPFFYHAVKPNSKFKELLNNLSFLSTVSNSNYCSD